MAYDCDGILPDLMTTHSCPSTANYTSGPSRISLDQMLGMEKARGTYRAEFIRYTGFARERRSHERSAVVEVKSVMPSRVPAERVWRGMAFQVGHDGSWIGFPVIHVPEYLTQVAKAYAGHRKCIESVIAGVSLSCRHQIIQAAIPLELGGMARGGVRTAFIAACLMLCSGCKYVVRRGGRHLIIVLRAREWERRGREWLFWSKHAKTII